MPEATSLAIVTGGPVDRSALLAALVEELAARYDDVAVGRGPAPGVPRAVRARPGQQVQVAVPGGEVSGRGRSTSTRAAGSWSAPTTGRSAWAPGTSSTSARWPGERPSRVA